MRVYQVTNNLMYKQPKESNPTTKEQLYIGLLWYGYGPSLVAKTLEIPEKRVKDYYRRIRIKYKCANNTQLAMLFWATRGLNPDEVKGTSD